MQSRSWLQSRVATPLLSRVPLNLLLWSCILSLALLSHLVNLPELLKAFLVLPLLVIIPEQLGEVILGVIRRFVKDLPIAEEAVSKWTISWLVGTVSLTVLTLLLQMCSLSLAIKNLHWLLVGILSFDLAYHNLYGNYSRSADQRGPALALADFRVVLLVVLIGLVPVLIHSYFGPFPLIRTAFGLPKIVVQPVRRMVEDGYLMWNLTSHKSALIVLVAVASALFNTDPLSIVWSGPFLLYAVFALGFYLWAYELSRSKPLSVLVTLFGVFVLAAAPIFEGIPLRLRSSSVQYALLPLFLYLLQKNFLRQDYQPVDMFLALPLASLSVVAFFTVSNLDHWFGGVSINGRTQVYTLLSVIMPLVALVLRSTLLARNQARDIFLFLVFLTTFEFQFHIFEAPLHLAVLWAYIGLAWLLRRPALRPWFWLSITSLWLVLILRLTGIINIPEFSPFSSAAFAREDFPGPLLDLSRKYSNFTTAHSSLVLILFVLGIVFMALSAGSTEMLILSMVTLTCFLYVLPDTNSYRFHKQVTPFMAYILAWIVFKTYMRVKRRLLAGTRYLPAVTATLMAVALLPNLVYPFYQHYSARPLADGSYPTILADYEYATSDWLGAHLPQNVRLISDYYTMHVVTELADKVHLIEFPINPGEMSEAGRDQLWHIKNNVFREANGASARAAVYELVGTEPYEEKEYLAAIGESPNDVSFAVVLTGRTSQWIEQEGVYMVSTPYAADFDVNPLYLRKFYDLRYFNLLYQVGEKAYIFQVKQPAPAAKGSAQYYVDRGNEYWSRGEEDAALAEYQKAVETDPLEAEGYIALGEAYRARRDYGNASAAFQEAARLLPKSANLQMALGEIRTRQGDLQGAAEAYREAVTLRPDLRDTHVALGKVYLQLNAPDKALAQFEVAVRLYARDSEASAYLESARGMLERWNP